MINIPEPEWKTSITKTILDLDKLRTRFLWGEIPAYLFFQMKEIFHMLETIGSARIEGNNTTLAEYIEDVIDKGHDPSTENNRELINIDKAIHFIEKNTDAQTPINRAYLSQLHKLATDGLTPPPKGEGSRYPGQLRKNNVTIGKADHKPADVAILKEQFDDFIEFINAEHIEQNQLLMVAIAHHRFMYIHPFDNGNGRVGRLLNYALLIKLGFNVKDGRIINASSVFYTDRDKYYDMLACADSLKDKDVLDWCEYFLNGLRNEIEKIDNLMSAQFTRKQILLPTLKFALEREHITKQEFDILKVLVNKKKMVIKASALEALGLNTPVQRSRAIKQLRDKRMLVPIAEGKREYRIEFLNNYLLRGMINALKENGFVADFLNRN